VAISDFEFGNSDFPETEASVFYLPVSRLLYKRDGKSISDLGLRNSDFVKGYCCCFAHSTSRARLGANNRRPHMNKHQLEQRTKRFALRIIAFVANLPRGRVGDVVGYQLLKAGTSVGANYREANRAESKNDFIHKIAIVEKESSESHYWLELINESKLGDIAERAWLLNEAGELLAIFTSVGKTSKRNQHR